MNQRPVLGAPVHLLTKSFEVRQYGIAWQYIQRHTFITGFVLAIIVSVVSVVSLLLRTAVGEQLAGIANIVAANEVESAQRHHD